ncbi:RcnB family protein [Phenylobacterium sp.]|jgi:Ni/Co efflux regulator RcnB|uniref:RcnB family protein n=1 Tax=Phenylobacterium sp. TaxID=1871053 RepID=UPI002F92E7D6
MNRLLAILFAAATVAGPLFAAPDAWARDDDGRRWEQRAERRGPERLGREMGGGRAWRAEDGPGRGRVQPPDRERRFERDDGRNYYGPPPGAYAPPRAYGLRRGGYLPPQAQGSAIEDYSRYRLRPPPRGFRWVRVGGAYALVGPDGQIFDMIR